MGIALKVRLLEVLLSLPLTACIVSAVWFGCMRQFFEVPLPGDEGIFFQPSVQAQQQITKTVAQSTPLFANGGGGGGGESAAAKASGQQTISVVSAEARVQEKAVDVSGAELEPWTENEKKIQAFLDLNSTRKHFGLALANLGLTGNAVEIGASGKGSFADVILSTWATPKYFIVDSNINSEQDLPPLLQQKYREGRVEVVHEYIEESASHFPNDHFHFIYINPSSSFRGLKKDLEDWFPKLKDGGILAGKDYCASHNEKSSPQNVGFFSKRPWCGTYQAGSSKAGKEKAGFGKYTVRSVDTFAEEVGKHTHFTLEGRDPANPYDSDGLANPSWWIAK